MEEKENKDSQSNMNDNEITYEIRKESLNILLETIEKELEYERRKKEILENKGNWLLTILGVFITLYFQIRLGTESSFINYLLLSIIIIIVIVLSLLILIKVIKPKASYLQLGLEKLDIGKIEESGLKGTRKLIEAKKEIIGKYRETFEKQSILFEIAVWLIFVVFICILILEITTY